MQKVNVGMNLLYLPSHYSQQRQHEKKRYIYPVHLAMEAQYYRDRGHNVTWVNPWEEFNRDELFVTNKIIRQPEGLPFLSLPHPDREWTNAKDPRYLANGNFKYLPATYIQSASGCWWGKCSFCVEQKNKWQVRPVENVIDEIVECRNQGYREIFDDSATFPTGQWLTDFCHAKYDFRPDLTMGCNMRMVDVDYALMKRAGFRMILFGLESGNQSTLDRINKGTKVEDVKWIIKASRAGLEPHIAVMFGYPWESDSDAENTLKLVHSLLKKGYAKTAQCSLYDVEGVEPNRHYGVYTKRLYDIVWSTSFWFHQLKDIRNVDDIRYLWKKIKAGLNP